MFAAHIATIIYFTPELSPIIVARLPFIISLRPWVCKQLVTGMLLLT